MTVNAGKYVLSGYLAVATAGIVYALTSSHELFALLQSAAAHQPLSWPLVFGMGIFILLFAGTVFFSVPTNPLFYLAAGYLFGSVTGSVLPSLPPLRDPWPRFIFFAKPCHHRRCCRGPKSRTFSSCWCCYVAHHGSRVR